MNKTVISTIIVLALIVACVPTFQTATNCATDEESSAPAITGGAVINTEPETPSTQSKANDGTPLKKVKEGELVSFPNLNAVDPDGDKLKYTFTPPLNEKGEWQTKLGDAGEYKITITADDGKNKAAQTLLIIVEGANKPPTIKIPKEINAKEGQTVTLRPDVKDPEGDKVTITYSGYMKEASKQLGYSDAGKHLVEITATDGVNTIRESAYLIVEDLNRAPTLETINDIKVTEGDKVSLKPRASDLDGDKVSLTFTPPFDNLGVWQTEKGDAGTYRINVTANDGKGDTTVSFTLQVASTNQPPTLEFRESIITVNEGDVVTIYPEVTDPENDAVRVTYTGWMITDTYQTDHDDSGVHSVTVTATDGINKVVKTVTVNVRDVNRPPQFAPGAFE